MFENQLFEAGVRDGALRGRASMDVAQARLRLLQQNDPERGWHALDQKRVCLLCGTEFDGSQIRILARAGKPVFRCPQSDCTGSLPHFAAAGNPLLDDATWQDWMRLAKNAADK